MTNNSDLFYVSLVNTLSANNAENELRYLEKYWLFFDGEIIDSPGCINTDRNFSDVIADTFGVPLPYPDPEVAIAFVPGIIVFQENEYHVFTGLMSEFGEKKWFLAECFDIRYLEYVCSDDLNNHKTKHLPPVRFSYPSGESYRKISDNTLALHPFKRGNGDWVAWGESGAWRLYTINSAQSPGRIFWCKKELAYAFLPLVNSFICASSEATNYSDHLHSDYFEVTVKTWPKKLKDRVINDSIYWSHSKKLAEQPHR